MADLTDPRLGRRLLVLHFAAPTAAADLVVSAPRAVWA